MLLGIHTEKGGNASHKKTVFIFINKEGTYALADVNI